MTFNKGQRELLEKCGDNPARMCAGGSWACSRYGQMGASSAGPPELVEVGAVAVQGEDE